MQVTGLDMTNQDSDSSSCSSSPSMTRMDVGQEEQVGLGADNYNDTSTPLDEADHLEEYQGDADLDAMIYNSRSCNGVDKQPTGPAVVRTSIVSQQLLTLRPAIPRNCQLQDKNKDCISIWELKGKIHVLRRWKAHTRDC